jgi:ligand-binding sensor domain-containing protein
MLATSGTLFSRQMALPGWRTALRWPASMASRGRVMKVYGLPSDQIIDLAVAPDGALWAITAGGIGYFGGRGWKSVELDHSLGAAEAMAFAPDGSIWLGTSRGVVHLQPQPGTNRRHTCTRDLPRTHQF